MFVRVRTPNSGKKKVVHIGEEVSVQCMPGKTPLNRVDTTHPPMVAAVRRVDGRKMATISYRDSVDGELHLVEVPPSSLEGSEDSELNIGDRVVLIKDAPSVCVTVGSKGTVVGGDEVYTVTFQMTQSRLGDELEHVVTVTQDQVPRDVLRFEGEATDEDTEETSDSDMDIEEVDEPEGRGVMMMLKRQLPEEVLEEVVLILNLDEMEELSACLATSDVDINDVDSVLALLD